ncbi:MAG: hypothetical protein KIT07_01645 [Anaerolineales bacterium]|nr:hypothetical protein [Anaerolineales bacterium]
MNPLQQYANQYAEAGWEIGSMTDHQFVATRRKGMNPLVGFIGILGLLFYFIPGLLILLLGYVARGTETKVVTEMDAQEWVAGSEQEAQELKAEQEEKQAAREKKIAELSDSPLRYWYMISETQKGLLVLAIVILILIVINM